MCFEKKIVIEVDGGQHAIEKEKDSIRDEWLKGQGFKVLRFWNNEVLMNIESVLEVIRKVCLSPSLTPPIKGGEVKKGIPSKEGKKVVIPSMEGEMRGVLP